MAVMTTLLAAGVAVGGFQVVQEFLRRGDMEGAKKVIQQMQRQQSSQLSQSYAEEQLTGSALDRSSSLRKAANGARNYNMERLSYNQEADLEAILAGRRQKLASAAYQPKPVPGTGRLMQMISRGM